MTNSKLYSTLKSNKKLRLSIILTIFLSLMLCIPSVTFNVKAVDIIVDDDGGFDYPDIQTAINNANPGDYIWVKDGSYNEQLTVNVQDLTIIADNGATPIIYVSSYNPGIDVTASGVIIDGFKIYGNADPLPAGGPTIRASAGADDLVIRNCQIAVVAGKIGNVALQATSGVTDVEFTSNRVYDFNIGIELLGTSIVSVPSTTNRWEFVNHTLYTAAHQGGTTRYHGSIQNAVNSVTDGGTVTVSEGTFNENVVISRSVILNGEFADINPNLGRTGEESTIDGNTQSPIRIASGVENVTINGFTLTAPNKIGSSNQAGILIGSDTKNIIIKNNIIEDITDGAGADTVNDETYGIMVFGHTVGGSQSKITILNNLITNVEEYGIAINDITSNVTIEGNVITELIGSDHTGDGVFDPSWPDMICSCIHLGGQVGRISNITIEDNILNSNVTGDGTTTYAGGGVSFAGIDELIAPNRPWDVFKDIFVINNEIYGNSMGIVGLAGKSNGSINVIGNNLSENTLYGLYNLIPDAHFNAISNWWGHISGPYNAVENPTGTGTEVTGNSTFWPWYEFDWGSIQPFVDYIVGTPKTANGGIVKDTTDIKIVATDDQSGMDSLTYRIWDPVNRWSPWMTYTSDINLQGEGMHVVQYNATDKAGTQAIDSHYHRVDTQSPVVQVSYPNGGEFVSGNLQIKWTAADKILDQEQVLRNSSTPLSEDSPGHIQSFIPTENEMRSVQLLLYGDNANVSVKLYSAIQPVPIPIAQSSIHLQNIGNPNNPIWVDFPFATDIDLDTTKTYYIGVTQEIYGNTGFTWYSLNSSGGADPYKYGHAWIKTTDALLSYVDLDWCFRTMYWNDDIDITVQYSMTGVSPWSTLAENEFNDGSYNWNTETFPDGQNYRVRIVAEDEIVNLGIDDSDGKFTIDNDGPKVTDIVVKDTSISNTQYIKDGDNLEISATITGNPVDISADLSGFGKGSSVSPTSAIGTTYKWTVPNVICSPSNGIIQVLISATDTTGDSGYNEGTIIADNIEPLVSITRPGPGLYIMDSMRLLPFAYPLIIGQITVAADATDQGSGIDRVEFYLENDLESNTSEVPYEWLWDRAATGFFDIYVVAYDKVGHEVMDEVRDLFIINLDIWG